MRVFDAHKFVVIPREQQHAIGRVRSFDQSQYFSREFAFGSEASFEIERKTRVHVASPREHIF